jgi:polar amino acid transport system substrate-binding protein
MFTQRLLYGLVLQTLAGIAHAECSRDIMVPFSDVGVDLRLVDGKHAGLSVDYLAEVERRTGCHFVYVDVPRARAWWMLAHDQADVVPGAIQTDWRDDTGVFYDQYVQEGVSLLSLKSSPLSLNSIEAILDSKLSFAFVRGHDYGSKTAELVRALEARDQLVLVKDPRSMLRMLQAGRVDAALVMASIVTTEAQSLGLHDGLHGVGIEDLEWPSTGIYLSDSSLSQRDYQLLASAISTLNQEGFYVHAYQRLNVDLPKWVGKGFRYDRSPPKKKSAEVQPVP